MTGATVDGPPPAGWYRDRDMSGQERWWDGVAWTEHTRAAPVHARPGAAASGACPHCGSTDTTALKMIVANGTTRGTTQGTAAGWVQGSGNQSGHTATFSTYLRTTTLTEAARAAAAPRKRWNGLMLAVLGIAVGGFGGWGGYQFSANNIGPVALDLGIPLIVGAVLIVWGLVLAVGDAAYNSEVFPEASARWSRSWQCQRCGTVFQL